MPGATNAFTEGRETSETKAMRAKSRLTDIITSCKFLFVRLGFRVQNKVTKDPDEKYRLIQNARALTKAFTIRTNDCNKLWKVHSHPHECQRHLLVRKGWVVCCIA
jgi:hypothetical protein